MKKYAIIVAGGSGQRMGSTTPKQLLLLAGEPVIMHTIRQVHGALPEATIIVTLPETAISEWESLCREHHFGINHTVTAGGATRFESVNNGLAHTTEDGIIGIHDGVRPLVSHEVIQAAYRQAEEFGAAIPCLPVTESLRKKDGSRTIAVNRSDYFIVQTPQCFRSDLLLSAYEQPYRETFTDDASVVESAGHPIDIVSGNPENIKITTPADLEMAEALLKSKGA